LASACPTRVGTRLVPALPRTLRDAAVDARPSVTETRIRRCCWNRLGSCHTTRVAPRPPHWGPDCRPHL